jgi:hypothetical protein
MTVDKPVRPKTPWLTIAVQVMGAIAIWDGVRIIIDSAGCDRGCTSSTVGALAIVWGVIALASGIRGRVGFLALITAIVTPLVLSWAWFFLGIMFLLIVSVTAAMSKGQLTPYYRWHKEATP